MALNTTSKFKRLRIHFDQSGNPSTASLPRLHVWNPDGGPDANIYSGTPDSLPDLFEALGFQVVEFQRTAPAT